MWKHPAQVVSQGGVLSCRCVRPLGYSSRGSQGAELFSLRLGRRSTRRIKEDRCHHHAASVFPGAAGQSSAYVT